MILSRLPASLLLMSLALLLPACDDEALPTAPAEDPHSITVGVSVDGATPIEPEAPAIGVSTESALAPTDPVTIAASIWKREVLVMEPIFLTIEITNNTAEDILIVPPYCGPPGPTHSLQVYVRGPAEELVLASPDYPEYAGPVSFGQRDPWLRGRMRIPKWPVRIGPGEAWHNVIDVTLAYPLDEPGEYGIEAQYVPDPSVLSTDHPIHGATPVSLTDAASLDAGTVTVRQASGRDRTAADAIVARRDETGEGLMGMRSAHGHHVPAEERRAFHRTLLNTSYRPYSEYMLLMSQPDAEAAWMADHSDFPLCSRAAMWAAARSYSAATGSTGGGAGSDPPAPGVDELRSELLSAARATRNIDTYQSAEILVWAYEDADLLK